MHQAVLQALPCTALRETVGVHGMRLSKGADQKEGGGVASPSSEQEEEEARVLKSPSPFYAVL